MQLKGFKPCYKWNAFNTHEDCRNNPGLYGFKPCYKWNAFNTSYDKKYESIIEVLNLVISGMPSIPLILLEY